MDRKCEHVHLQRESEWQRQHAIIHSILQSGMKEYACNIPGIHRAFECEDRTLCCIDEGTPVGNMRSAGSGILTAGDEREAFFAIHKAAGIEAVTSHTGCGAAALYRELQNITDKTVDEVAIEHAKFVAETLGVRYAGHVEDLKRPSEFHNARVVYVDGTGVFNPSCVEELPQGFVVSRRYMRQEQTLSEVRLACKIAFGHHGFAERFSSESPLLIITIGDPAETEFACEHLHDELLTLKEYFDQTEPENSVRIRFDQWEKQVYKRPVQINLDYQDQQVV